MAVKGTCMASINAGSYRLAGISAGKFTIKKNSYKHNLGYYL